jgi:LAO/AO transport system kinase
MKLSEKAMSGDRLALAKVLTEVESGSELAGSILEEMFPSTGQAYIIGVTGAPGSGKSSLVNQMVLTLRNFGENFPNQTFPARPHIAVIAVDPTSPFSGGAVLGDRVRMRDLSGDETVFIRSMASRGMLGGLALATSDMVQVFDAAGYELVIIETVGVGQAEVEIAGLAHTTIVVAAPGMGDEVQAIKSGILEIADVLVLNKADLQGADSAETNLLNALRLPTSEAGNFAFLEKSQHHRNSDRIPMESDSDSMQHFQDSPMNGWFTPFQKTISTTGEGVFELVCSILAHRQYLIELNGLKDIDHNRLKSQVDRLCIKLLNENWSSRLDQKYYNEILDSVYMREISPRSAAKKLTERNDV